MKNIILLQLLQSTEFTFEEVIKESLHPIEPYLFQVLLIIAGLILLLITRVSFSFQGGGVTSKNRSPLIDFIAITLIIGSFSVISHDLYTKHLASPIGNIDEVETIDRAFASGLAAEDDPDDTYSEKYYEQVLRKFNRPKNGDHNEYFYYKAKILYRYGSVLSRLKKYRNAAKSFGKAYDIYLEHSSFFDAYSVNENRLRSSDFPFDVERAYDARARQVSNYRNALLTQHRRKNQEDLFQDLGQILQIYEEILDKEPGYNPVFRSRVWLDMGKVYEDLNDKEKARVSYIASYLVFRENPEAKEKLMNFSLIDENGALLLSSQELAEIESSKKILGQLIYSENSRVGIGEDEFASSSVQENNLQKGNDNFFPRSLFPLASCGDAKPLNPEEYPTTMYPIYVNYTEERLNIIRENFCADAFHNTKADAIQVASFLNRDRGHYFTQIMQEEFGEDAADAGPGHRFDSVDTRSPTVVPD